MGVGLQTLSKEEKERILRAVEEDREFRLALAGAIGFKELLDRFARLEERQQKLEERFAQLEERFAKLEERFVKLEERVAKLEERFVELTERFARLEERQQRLEERFIKLDERVAKLEISVAELKITVGSLGRRLGRDLEKTVLSIYRDQAIKLGIDPDKVSRFTYRDREGLLGTKGAVYEFDVVIQEDGVVVLEVKSLVELDDVEWFYEKVVKAEKVLGKVKKKVVVAVNIAKDALERAKELGVEVIYGAAID